MTHAAPTPVALQHAHTTAERTFGRLVDAIGLPPDKAGAVKGIGRVAGEVYAAEAYRQAKHEISAWQRPQGGA